MHASFLPSFFLSGRPSVVLDSLFGVQHDDRVSPDDDHADLGGPAAVLLDLHRLVQDKVHEGVVAAKDALDGAAAVDL